MVLGVWHAPTLERGPRKHTPLCGGRNPGPLPVVSPDVTTSEEASAESSDATAGKRPRRRRLLLLPLFALALVAAFAPFVWVVAGTSGYRHATVADVPERPVALVLGAGVREDGLPTRVLARRLELAADLYFAGKAEVLLVSGDDGVTIGTPTVAGAVVSAEVVEQTRGKKITVFKKKRRKHYRRTLGHRQDLTRIRITDIAIGG